MTDKQEPDWKFVSALLDAHAGARQAGLLSGTSNWGAFIAGSIAAPPAQPAPTQEPRNVTSQEDAVLRAAASGTLIAKGRMAAPAQRLSDDDIDTMARTYGVVYKNRHYPDDPAVAFSNGTLHLFARAIEAAIVPPGFCVVPVDATKEMCVAAVKVTNGDAVYKNVSQGALDIEEETYAEVYAAMLAAAKDKP